MSVLKPVSLALLLGLAAMAPAHAGVPEALRGEWLAEDIRGGGVVDRVQTRIEINDKGQVSGSGGCNRIHGSVEVKGAAITFGRLGSTMMACPEAVMAQEHKFLTTLEDVKGWKVDEARSKLHLLDAGGKTLIVLAQD